MVMGQDTKPVSLPGEARSVFGRLGGIRELLAGTAPGTVPPQQRG
jgi:hypothetical protein